MGGQMDVDPERIRSAGSGIRSSAEQLKSEWTSFQGELASYGQPWGNDDLGSLIGMCYQAIVEVAQECYEENTGDIGDHAEGVHAMATNYQETEKETTGQVKEINRVRDVLG